MIKQQKQIQNEKPRSIKKEAIECLAFIFILLAIQLIVLWNSNSDTEFLIQNANLKHSQHPQFFTKAVKSALESKDLQIIGCSPEERELFLEQYAKQISKDYTIVRRNYSQGYNHDSYRLARTIKHFANQYVLHTESRPQIFILEHNDSQILMKEFTQIKNRNENDKIIIFKDEVGIQNVFRIQINRTKQSQIKAEEQEKRRIQFEIEEWKEKSRKEQVQAKKWKTQAEDWKNKTEQLKTEVENWKEKFQNKEVEAKQLRIKIENLEDQVEDQKGKTEKNQAEAKEWKTQAEDWKEKAGKNQAEVVDWKQKVKQCQAEVEKRKTETKQCTTEIQNWKAQVESCKPQAEVGKKKTVKSKDGKKVKNPR